MAITVIPDKNIFFNLKPRHYAQDQFQAQDHQERGATHCTFHGGKLMQKFSIPLLINFRQHFSGANGRVIEVGRVLCLLCSGGKWPRSVSMPKIMKERVPLTSKWARSSSRSCRAPSSHWSSKYSEASPSLEESSE